MQAIVSEHIQNMLSLKIFAELSEVWKLYNATVTLISIKLTINLLSIVVTEIKHETKNMTDLKPCYFLSI